MTKDDKKPKKEKEPDEEPVEDPVATTQGGKCTDPNDPCQDP